MNDQPHSLFDVAAIRTALQQSGLAPSELAFRVDFAVRSLQRILNGDPDPGEIRVATLARLANHLGLPLRSLLAAPPVTTTTAVDAEVDPVAADDAATVTALLYDRTTPTLNDHLAEALDWSLDRLQQALTEADRRLRMAGLRIVREHGESRVQPLHDHVQARRDLTQVHAHRSGLKPYEYQAAYQTYTGQAITAPNETRRRVITGGLANAGLLDLTEEEPALSAAAEFAHP
ncbi:helix-turn-helix domain-containing protein [Blastococcus sp. KM273129]|uniref:helix-turn-helix domain-containing protein n=1 Tax=Blastococcus sp. KM273129 TaxID=2570315 RepID=UPI001F39F68E|nr:helix-turn-helix transcriptional regulator [Blastococcus sp. KM273129]MCF6735239.1 helix-turn-helix transcriptional regulator [Blastococcus sp. KM273129]